MTTATDTRQANADALRAYAEGHDMSRLADDATFTDVTTGMTWTGPHAIEGMLDWFYSGAFNARLEDRSLIVADDGSGGVLEATFVGTHQGEFAGIPATGREVRVPLVVVYGVEGGRVVSGRIHFDVAAFVAQATGR